MKLLAAIFALTVCLGCGNSISLPAFGAPKAPADHITELKVVARRRHLWWRIQCTGGERDWAYLADLCQTDCELLYEEEGGKPRWIGNGNTQQNAAADLLLELDKHPQADYVFRHTKNLNNGKECPPELSGGPEDK